MFILGEHSMAQRKFNLAVAGATGAVGNQMIRCLEEMDFPVQSVVFLASKRSVGRRLKKVQYQVP